MSRTVNEGVPTVFLILAVAVSFAVGGVGYLSGSAPEWIVLKSSVGLLAVGLAGLLVSALVMVKDVDKSEPAKGSNVDVTLSETIPANADSDSVVAGETVIDLNEASATATNTAVR